MTAVTVTDRTEAFPAFDIAAVTATDGYTFATKLSSPVAAFVFGGGGHAAGTCSISGQTITIKGVSLSAETVYVMVVGRL
jgi:hypothetical protein